VTVFSIHYTKQLVNVWLCNVPCFTNSSTGSNRKQAQISFSINSTCKIHFFFHKIGLQKFYFQLETRNLIFATRKFQFVTHHINHFLVGCCFCVKICRRSRTTVLIIAIRVCIHCWFFLSQLLAVGFCRGYLPQVFPLDICRGFLVCKRFFFVCKYFFLGCLFCDCVHARVLGYCRYSSTYKFKSYFFNFAYARCYSNYKQICFHDFDI